MRSSLQSLHFLSDNPRILSPFAQDIWYAAAPLDFLFLERYHAMEWLKIDHNIRLDRCQASVIQSAQDIDPGFHHDDVFPVDSRCALAGASHIDLPNFHVASHSPHLRTVTISTYSVFYFLSHA